MGHLGLINMDLLLVNPHSKYFSNFGRTKTVNTHSTFLSLGTNTNRPTLSQHTFKTFLKVRTNKNSATLSQHTLKTCLNLGTNRKTILLSVNTHSKR